MLLKWLHKWFLLASLLAGCKLWNGFPERRRGSMRHRVMRHAPIQEIHSTLFVIQRGVRSLATYNTANTIKHLKKPWNPYSCIFFFQYGIFPVNRISCFPVLLFWPYTYLNLPFGTYMHTDVHTILACREEFSSASAISSGIRIVSVSADIQIQVSGSKVKKFGSVLRYIELILLKSFEFKC